MEAVRVAHASLGAPAGEVADLDVVPVGGATAVEAVAGRRRDVGVEVGVRPLGGEEEHRRLRRPRLRVGLPHA